MRQLIIIFLLGTSACTATEVTWTLRECRTTNGEHFEYQQSSHEPLAEEFPTVVNRYGVYDTQGWWHNEETIITCRNKPHANPR